MAVGHEPFEEAVGAGPGVEVLAQCMAMHGSILLYGRLTSEETPFPLIAAMQKQLRVQGYTLFQVTGDPAWLERGKAFVTAGLESGALRPVIARTFALDDIVGAHRFMESNQQTGKIVVVP